MEIKLTEQELLLLRMIIARYESELETLIDDNAYRGKYDNIYSEAALEAVHALNQKICLADLEIYVSEMEDRKNAKSLDD